MTICNSLFLFSLSILIQPHSTPLSSSRVVASLFRSLIFINARTVSVSTVTTVATTYLQYLYRNRRLAFQAVTVIKWIINITVILSSLSASSQFEYEELCEYDLDPILE